MPTDGQRSEKTRKASFCAAGCGAIINKGFPSVYVVVKGGMGNGNVYDRYFRVHPECEPIFRKMHKGEAAEIQTIDNVNEFLKGE